MKQPISIQISIPQPCHEDWDKMTPQDKGRFCDSCQKCVVDFRNYSDEELYKYIAAHRGEGICGRVHTSQLSRKISLPPQPHSQLYKWVMAAGLALVLAATPESKVFAQAPLTEHTAQQKNSSEPDTFSIRGIVVDENNEPVVGAVIKAIYKNQLMGGTVSDFDGNYLIKPLKDIPYTIKISFVGYKEFVYENYTIDNGHITTTLETDTSVKLDDITIVVGLIETFEPTICPNHVENKYDPPLYDPNEHGNTRTFTSDEIEKGAY